MARHLPIKPLDVEFPAIARSIGVMTLKNRTLSPMAELFIEQARTSAATAFIPGSIGARARR
jgi:hypothetical protein